ncbi:BA75_00284T0 [Komagataella pastoris]|uniref:BA75_00284T0 n=1 Tax=Komagataella pastoris TaxID=4922 RepID=A0A1B2J9K0_PICPA|nr:BA75_00284T0 [Komagataella pastoris]
MLAKGARIQRFKSTSWMSSRTFLNLGRLTQNSELKGNGQQYVVRKTFHQPKSVVYSVISNVDKYHEFIPYCEASFINSRDSKGEPTEAGLTVGFKSFDETFLCTLECQKDKQVIAKSITHSLFHSLLTEWNVTEASSSKTNVELILSYEFKSDLYNQISALFATKVTSIMIKAFEKRAYTKHKQSCK